MRDYRAATSVPIAISHFGAGKICRASSYTSPYPLISVVPRSVFSHSYSSLAHASPMHHIPLFITLAQRDHHQASFLSAHFTPPLTSVLSVPRYCNATAFCMCMCIFTSVHRFGAADPAPFIVDSSRTPRRRSGAWLRVADQVHLRLGFEATQGACSWIGGRCSRQCYLS
jgi:hypothetical protein